LLFLAFPTHDLSYLVWVGFVPLLIAISGKSLKAGFFLAYICGIVFFAGVFSWIFDVPGFKFYHHILLSPYEGLYFGFFGLAFNFISRRRGFTAALLTAPFIWVCLEYIRSNLSFLALPWALLAHSQYQVLPVIQIASVTGACGVSFVVVMVNSALVAILLPLVYRPGQNELTYRQVVSNKGRNAVAGASAVFVAVTLLYGYLKLSAPVEGKTIKISVVQGNIDREKKRNPLKHTRYIMQKYADLTRRASQDGAAMIVWPEAATPGFIFKNMTAYKEMMAIIREVKTPLLVGSAEYPKFAKAQTKSKKSNTALFFSSEGRVLGQYLKIRLVPFWEYVPYEETFKWPEFIVAKKKASNVAGKEFTTFEIEGAKFGVVICWEIAFPWLFSRFADDGANFMINITNEGWFGENAAPYQMLSMSVFRAVENRVYLVRAANTGISCFIDPHGKINGRVRNNNKDIYVEGYLTQEIIALKQKTFYTAYGDIFVYLCMLVTAVVLIFSFFAARGKFSFGQDRI
ncbi:MAG: apolipoprotein N-acyltransferase, partial [Desulfobacterales bacterium]